MCGIIAYIGKKEALPILLNGLKRLEYRGYDSAGIGILSQDLSEIKIIKERGKVEVLEKLAKEEELTGNIGIAHTRWATHGEPNKINAHPHFSCNKEIAVVHNGIIENYFSLRKFLESKGHKFISETDTEVIPHLIEEFTKEHEFEEAVRLALKQLKGAYGIAILKTKENKIIGAKKGSPLMVGISNHGIFLASDVVAFLEHTKKVNYLKDGEMVIIHKNNFEIKDLERMKIKKKIEEIELNLEQIEKGKYETFMHKEIHEQKYSIENAFRGRILEKDVKIDGIEEIIKKDPLFFKKISRIILLGCGSSWHAALYGKYLIESFARIPCCAEDAAEFHYRNPVLLDKDFLIVISQSGETADTKGALEYVKKKSKIRTFGIVNVVGSTISRLVDSGIYIHAGPEIGVASTKAFTGQLVCLYLLALKIAKEKNLIGKEIKEHLEELRRIPKKIGETLKQEEKIREIAKKYKDVTHFLYLGRGINYPIALEGALKLKEIAYIPCDGLSASEMKHGPIALVDENMASVFVAPKDELYEKILSNMEEIKSRGGKVIVITTKKTKEVEKIANDIVYIPESNKYLLPILGVIPLQLFAYHLALLKKRDVDKPRNLAKSVTVE